MILGEDVEIEVLDLTRPPYFSGRVGVNGNSLFKPKYPTANTNITSIIASRYDDNNDRIGLVSVGLALEVESLSGLQSFISPATDFIFSFFRLANLDSVLNVDVTALYYTGGIQITGTKVLRGVFFEYLELLKTAEITGNNPALEIIRLPKLGSGVGMGLDFTLADTTVFGEELFLPGGADVLTVRNNSVLPSIRLDAPVPVLSIQDNAVLNSVVFESSLERQTESFTCTGIYIIDWQT